MKNLGRTGDAGLGAENGESTAATQLVAEVSMAFGGDAAGSGARTAADGVVAVVLMIETR
jgi:hypothetical protein